MELNRQIGRMKMEEREREKELSLQERYCRKKLVLRRKEADSSSDISLDPYLSQIYI